MKKAYNRRSFIQQGVKASAAIALSSSVVASFAASNTPTVGASAIGYTQQPLPYGYQDLEIAIDALTMEIHYTKHAAGYAKNLAEACTAEKVNTATTSLEQLLATIGTYSVKMRNNAGGHYNHEFFWQCLTPTSLVLSPNSKLYKAIVQQFGSFDAFLTKFTDAAKTRFGSGWAWLVVDANKQLIIGSTPNQDNPLMPVSDVKGTPILGLDVWEHAYYLRYQNKRADYITNYWKIVNWQVIEQRYLAALG